MKKRICSLVLVMTLIFTSLAFTAPQKADAATSKFTVKFLPNGGVGSMSNQQFAYQQYQNIKKCEFKRSYYVFKGWYAHQATRNLWYCTNGTSFGWYNENKIPSGWRKNIISDGWRGDRLTNINNDTVYLIAQWASTYTICFDRGQDSSGYMRNYTMIYGSGKVIPECSFSKTGYTFVGWTAFRLSDRKMYFTNGTSAGWYKVGNQPNGWYLRIGPDKWPIHKATTVPGDTIILYAVWRNSRTGALQITFKK